jgi:hypothetical protein
MLEHRVLLLRGGTAEAERCIVDGDSGIALGTARWQHANGRGWRKWFHRRILEVREQEDEPLVFTVRRCWRFWPQRQVRDADEQEVGALIGHHVRDRFGRMVASFENGVFHAPDQPNTLAELTTTADGLRLTFDDDIAGEPFIKMLLLAASLLQPAPRVNKASETR